jgi:hypothetical protein
MKKNKNISVEQEYYRLFKIAASSNDPAAWQAAMDKINSVPQSSTLKNALDAMAMVATSIGPALKAIKDSGMGVADLKKLFSLGASIGGVTSAGIDIERIEKFSSYYIRSNRRQQEILLKKAGIMDAIGESGALGNITSLLPYAGVIYKGFTAFQSLSSALQSYRDLTSESEEFGLKWWETLFPGKLEPLFDQVKNDPEKMGNLGFICATAIVFIEGGIAGVLRAITASKESFDIIMSYVNEAVQSGEVNLGFLGGLAQQLPLINMMLEYGLKYFVTQSHKELLSKIMETIQSHIGAGPVTPPTQSRMPGPAPIAS